MKIKFFQKKTPKQECHHEWVGGFDASFCPKCGMENNVLGVFKWTGTAIPIIEQFYKSEIDQFEVARLFKNLKGYESFALTFGGKWDKRIFHW